MRNGTSKLKKIVPYLYITPISLILFVFVIGSVVISIVLGFTKYNIIVEPVFQGMENYRRLMEDVKFMKAVKNTFKLAIMIVPFQVMISLLASIIIHANRKRFLGKLANMIVFIPVLCSNAVVGVVWRELLNGKVPVVECFFGLCGMDPAMFLGNAKTALIVVAMVAVWKMVGYYVVIFSSGLLSIPEGCYEAAKVDGAGSMKRFLKITLPLLKPTIIMVLFLSIAGGLQCFDLIFNLTGGGPNNASTTLVVYAYQLCFSSGKAGYAMAVSNILFIVVLVVALWQRKLMSRQASEI